jgi:hypothetical protein
MNESKSIKRASSVFITFFILGLAAVVGLAIGLGVFDISFSGNPNYVYQYEVKLDNAEISSVNLLPGGELSITPKVTSLSTGNTYVFMKIECNTVDDGSGTMVPIYDFTDNDNDWTVVKRDGTDGYVLVVYGTQDTCSTFAPGAEITIDGTLKLDIDYAQYASFAGAEDPLKFTIHVCGIHSDDVLDLQAPSVKPLEAYAQYLIEYAGD